MPCYHPLQAYQAVDGTVIFTQLRRYDIVRSLQLPCGQCVGCRLERSRQWAMRCLHEASLYERNAFITLTYDQLHLPAGGGLVYSDFQNFMKRLRKCISPSLVRFYMCGEYGENFGRPHFHACLFGYDFPDKLHWKKTPSGCSIYRSSLLESLWPGGFSSIGDVTFESAAYVARYIMKKITGHLAEVSGCYEVVDPDTGEIHHRRPEFNKMSLKPGIGARWLEKWSTDVYPHDYVIINGKKVKPPKYYDKKYAQEHQLEFEDISFNRESAARLNFLDNSDARLLVKEIVTTSRLNSIPRKLS